MSSAKASLIKLIGTFFYAGYLPVMPGTFASAIGAGILLLIRGNVIVYACTLLACVCAGFAAGGAAEKLLKKKDSQFIVIDEVSGMLLSVLFLPHTLAFIAAAFILFRVLDIIKPYPARVIERLRGSLGVMGDDLLVALYTNIILQVVLRSGFLKTS